MSNDRKHRKIYRKRRKHQEHLSIPPLHRRLGKRAEQWSKRLFLGLISKWIQPRKISGPLNPTTLQSVLIIRNDAIGDMVLTTPFWRVLKQKNPHIRIGVVGSFRNLTVIAQDPDIDYRFECNSARLSEVWKVRRELKKYTWDLVLPMIYNKKTKMAIISKLFAPSAISSMILLPYDPVERYEKLYSICVQTSFHPSDGPLLDFMRMHLENTLAIEIEDEEWKPSIYSDEHAIQSVQATIDSILEADGTQAYIHINLDAKMEFKEYGYSNNFEVSRLLLNQYPGYSIIWTASPMAAKKAQSFLDSHQSERIHFVATPSIHELIGVVRGATMVISPDTSVIHIASAERTPVVGLYPIRHEWPPYKVPNVVLVPWIMGEPVSTIPIESVIDAVTQLFTELPQTEKVFAE